MPWFSMLKNQNLLDLTFCEKLWKITGKKFNICWIPLQSNLMFPVTSKKKLTSTKYQNILHMEGNFYEVQTTKCTKTLYQTDTIRPVVQGKKIFFSSLLKTSWK